jgi:hypothetical protein
VPPFSALQVVDLAVIAKLKQGCRSHAKDFRGPFVIDRQCAVHLLLDGFDHCLQRYALWIFVFHRFAPSWLKNLAAVLSRLSGSFVVYSLKLTRGWVVVPGGFDEI